MTQDQAYQHPIPYAELDPNRYKAILLPGGDTLTMRQYLENPVLQKKVYQFWQQGKLIGAICHGVLVLARTIDPQTGHSILYGRKVTALPSRWIVPLTYSTPGCSSVAISCIPAAWQTKCALAWSVLRIFPRAGLNGSLCGLRRQLDHFTLVPGCGAVRRAIR